MYQLLKYFRISVLVDLVTGAVASLQAEACNLRLRRILFLLVLFWS